jgi:NTE family protein
MELSESFRDIDKLGFFNDWPRLIARNFFPDYDFMKSISTERTKKGAEINDRFATKIKEQKIKINQFKAFYSSAIFGNDKMFVPRWSHEYMLTDQEYFKPQKWTYIYDHLPLVKTLEKYVDYDKLRPGGNSKIR